MTRHDDHRRARAPKLAHESVIQGVALCCLMIMGAFAIAGPYGLLAWGESRQALSQRRLEIHDLTLERDRLKNRVTLLDPRHADPDLTGELLRRNLNVVGRDDMVMVLNH